MADTEALADLIAERDVLREHLQFVERWANHHGQKPHVSAQEALSVIQHYPPIKAITESYSDGKMPDTPDPWAERDELRADVRELASALQTAVWRLDDMLRGDDGQAWKEAERAMPPLRALLAKHSRSKT